jgi:hydroxymethylpyrimidine/phosphomethylpyrimidine kinase
LPNVENPQRPRCYNASHPLIMNTPPSIPVVLCLSGHDPTGGAGIQADIETLASMGCHAATVITAITVQDTQDVKAVAPVDAELIEEQARAVLEDMPVAAFKIGLLASSEAVAAIARILNDYPDVPVVLDPVLASGNGTPLLEDDALDALLEQLLPHTTVLTPNIPEARQLAHGADSLDACAMQLLELGCEYVLITGTHDHQPDVVNTLYGGHHVIERYTWERLPTNYHGSGCTLAAGIVGLLAQGIQPQSAIHEAQEFTWQSLKAGYRIGMGQHLPNRLFWARDDDQEEN